MSICSNCKYYGTCGDDAREVKCEGFKFEAPADMKTYDAIIKTIDANSKKIDALKEKIDRLTYIDDRNAARAAHDYEALADYRKKADDNAAQVAKASADIELLTIINQILFDNSQVALFADAWQVIKDACAPYEGKPYGEKTKQRIREAVNAKGYGFYFSGYTYTDTLNIYKLDSRGCHCSGYKIEEVTAYAVDFNNGFVDADNRIRVADNEARIWRKYETDPRKRAREIQKAFRSYKAQAQKAHAAQDALNALLPSPMASYNKIDNPDYIYLTR